MLNNYERHYELINDENGCNRLVISVYYSKGSMMVYKPMKRGYYFSIQPEKIINHGTYTTYECVPMRGGKAYILPCDRQSKKRYEEAKKMLDNDSWVKSIISNYIKENKLNVSDTYTEKESERDF